MPVRRFEENPGGVLLSHQVALAVPSAPRSLTSEFGMGSGVAFSISPPEFLDSVHANREELDLPCQRGEPACDRSCDELALRQLAKACPRPDSATRSPGTSLFFRRFEARDRYACLFDRVSW